MSGTARLQLGAAPFPGYRLVRQIGQGGWGEVWQARTPAETDVALKFLSCHSDVCAPQEIRALQSIRQLDHPHLTRVDQIWCWDGYIVIAMELAEGSMIDLFDQYYSDFGTCIVPDHLCQYLMQAAQAVDFLNDRRHIVNGQRVAIRHCDIKPSNLLVFPGKVKLADFSLAAITTSPMWYQRRVGTLNYAAPEVFQGWLSDRTDLYALAVSYIELRTGKLPFSDTPAKFSKSYIRPQPDLSMVTPLERPILRRALAPVPQDRWRSCREMVERLAQATAGAQVTC